MHPIRGLLCPLSLLLRLSLSLADLWPVQWFAGPLSGPPLSLPFDLCVSVTRVVHIPPAPWRPALVGRLGPGVVPFGPLPAFDLGTFVVILLFLPRLLGSWSVYGSCFVYRSARRYIVFPRSALPVPPACTLPAVCRGRSHFQFFPASFSRSVRGSLCRRSCWPCWCFPDPSLARCASVSRN